jgi:hypothetical protein
MVAEEKSPSRDNGAVYPDEVETAAAIFAKFAHLLNPSVDEYHAFMIMRDYIVNEGIAIETVEELVFLLQETIFDPKRDKVH